MFEKAEQEYNELKRKKDVVEADKSRIQQVRRRAGRGAWPISACNASAGPARFAGTQVRSFGSCPDSQNLSSLFHASPPDHWRPG